jgi:hypothetical protein
MHPLLAFVKLPFHPAWCNCLKKEKESAQRKLPRSFLFQDDNFSLSLLNELSVKYGIQTHLSHAPLPQKLEELREYIRREIKKELKVRISPVCVLGKGGGGR